MTVAAAAGVWVTDVAFAGGAEMLESLAVAAAVVVAVVPFAVAAASVVLSPW